MRDRTAFEDDNGNVNEGNIIYLASLGILSGCNPPANNLICPDDPLIRGEAATMVTRAHTHARGINALAGLKITVGSNPPDNDLFCPSGLVTRGEMATFLVRFLSLGDRRSPKVSITTPPHLLAFTTVNGGANRFEADITFTVSAVDPTETPSSPTTGSAQKKARSASSTR